MRLGTLFRAEDTVTERLIGLRLGPLRFTVTWRKP